MPSVNWKPVLYRIRNHFSCLERFDLQEKLDPLEKFLQVQVFFQGLAGGVNEMVFMHEGDVLCEFSSRVAASKRLVHSYFARKRLFFTHRLTSGASTDSFWADDEARYPLWFRVRRQHFSDVMDEIGLDLKVFTCFTGKPDVSNRNSGDAAAGTRSVNS